MRTSNSLDSEFSWKPPLIAALVVLCTAGPLLWIGDFLLFFLAFPYAVVLGGICLLLLLRGLFAKEPGKRPTLILTAVAAAATFAAMYLLAAPASVFLHNRIGFEAWYITHHEVTDQYANRDAIITTWNEQGFGGMNFFSFLISDPDDTIGDNTERANVWAKRLESDCEVTDATRLRRGLYILSTYNCMLDDERKNPAGRASLSPP